jgi:hypothetical protein
MICKKYQSVKSSARNMFAAKMHKRRKSQGIK